MHKSSEKLTVRKVSDSGYRAVDFLVRRALIKIIIDRV